MTAKNHKKYSKRFESYSDFYKLTGGRTDIVIIDTPRKSFTAVRAIFSEL